MQAGSQLHAISVEDLRRLVRDEGKDPLAYFDSLQNDEFVKETATTIRFHRVGHDATLDRADIPKLLDKLIKLLIDFACTREEFFEALDELTSTKSAQAMAALQEKARRLFAKTSKTGEPGELLLYYLAEHLLKYPQVLCKLPLKTNPNVHAHGADGVHASVDPASGHLRLHWGESKLYTRIEDAVDDCFQSLRELILEPPDAKKTKRRDVELLRDNIALNDPNLETALLQYLDPDDILSKKVKFCGIALIGFNLTDYAKLSLELKEEKSPKIVQRTKQWIRQITSAIRKHELSSVTLDVFCLPFVSVEQFREEFLKRLN